MGVTVESRWLPLTSGLWDATSERKMDVSSVFSTPKMGIPRCTRKILGTLKFQSQCGPPFTPMSETIKTDSTSKIKVGDFIFQIFSIYRVCTIRWYFLHSFIYKIYVKKYKKYHLIVHTLYSGPRWCSNQTNWLWLWRWFLRFFV